MSMIVMANNSNMYPLAERFPGRIGLLISSRWAPSRGLPYAIDNGRFSVWEKGKPWQEKVFRRMLTNSQTQERPPEWVVVPDCVGDAAQTFREWERWAGRLALDGFRLALAVQDGMTPESVRQATGWIYQPEVIFVGGTRQWKRRTLWTWSRAFPRVHVGRVNAERWLWNADRCGAESCDGTGWFRGRNAQLWGLHRYLERSSAGLGPIQLELEFARTFGGKVAEKPFEKHGD